MIVCVYFAHTINTYIYNHILMLVHLKSWSKHILEMELQLFEVILIDRNEYTNHTNTYK